MLGRAVLGEGVRHGIVAGARPRLLAVGDLYYIYQHEKLGVFRAVLKLQELFRAGTTHRNRG